MSLFPAYAPDSSGNVINNDCQGWNGSLALEAQLLASDKEEDGDTVSFKAAAGVASTSHNLPEQNEYYVDCKLDYANLKVSTLYYPGRPQYDARAPRQELCERRRRRRRRYHSVPAPPPPDGAELAQRTRAYRDMLAKAPHDQALWLRFIEFQELCGSDEAALSAAEEAARQAGGARLRAELYRARARLPPPHRLRLLRADLAAAPAAAAAELWLRALADAAAAGGAELDAAAGAALAATRDHALAYPHILYAYGGYLRAAGLWERLVLLLELVTSMNFPPAAFPPPDDPQRRAEQERLLQELEDKAIGSGLPLSTVWVRVERARAAAHWRAPPAGSPAAADPQRAPLAADVAELLRPAAGAEAAALLLVHALRLAKVPLLPCSEYALRAVHAGGANEALGEAAEAEGGEALLALVRAARRLPASHPARVSPAVAERLVGHFLDPPHYFTDDAGYSSWVTSLWDACCEWTTGWRRQALLCWRLRWMHALVLVLDTQTEAGRREARRLRGSARAALKRFAGAEPLPFAQFARVELAAGEAAQARRAAWHALRAALRAPALPPHHRLYVARVAAELCAPCGDAAPAWATACAALAEPLPPDDHLCAPPPPDLLRRALLQCEAQCDSLEREFEQSPEAEGAEGSEGAGGGALGAQLPGRGEWAAARARLAPPARRAALLRRVRALGAAPPACARAARYWEHAACALLLAAARDQRLAREARALAPLFPHNALLALACSGAPLWAWDSSSTQEERVRALAGGARSHRGALAQLVPGLARVAAQHWAGPAAARLAAACARAARRGAAGALLHAVRLEAEARAARPRPARALLAALDRLPHHKWLAVRGAAWCGSEAAALADVLLERQLRVHALLDELAPPPNAI